MTHMRQAAVEYFRKKGMSEAELAYRFREDKPEWPENTIAGMYDEAAKWPGRILSFNVTATKSGEMNVKLVRVATPQAKQTDWECTLILKDTEEGAVRERVIRDFCCNQIVQIEKLGNPRWDALVAEESAK